MSERIPEDVRELIPARFVEIHRVVPLALQNDCLTVAHPTDVDQSVLRELAVLLNVRVEGEVQETRLLDDLIRANYGVGAQEIESLLKADGAPAASNGSTATSSADPDHAEEAAIVLFVNELLRQALDDSATDIHLEPFEDRMRVRFRIDGLLHDIPVPAHVYHYRNAVVSRVKVMAHLDIAEHRLPQDGKFRLSFQDETVDFRVSVLPTPHGEAVNIRVLASGAIRFGLPSLGLSEQDLGVVERVLAKPHGVVLVTGPTGSGKTTTLYAFLSLLNRTERKILTIEDPIEYDLHGITQIQVRPKVGLDFAQGLRSMLRHDPDVMMVGEIRDEETAETVIRVALTGHLVFSTVHTNDATSTPIRLLDMGVEPYLVASSVECIIAQRLVRQICPHCLGPDDRTHTPETLGVSSAALARVLAEGEGFQRGRGCNECRGTGYHGRTAVFEILPVTPRLRELILSRAPNERMIAEALTTGFWPLRWKGLALAAAGRTTVDEVLRISAAVSEVE